ncbi:MAG: NAD(P)-binding domain-containing protein [Nitriliruptoraceae bacterium]|nr:NAD(P)-binding domain-containing protein [Nitriliruptoraceae bacterium]
MAQQIHDVLIVGAGPAGLGVASALTRIGIAATVIDRDGIGASFRNWPEGMRLITPSFTGNQFGLVDLNAITPDTSPALSLRDEHPTGARYAAYLQMVAELDRIDVRTGIEVDDVRPRADGVLEVSVTDGPPWHARHVVWAAGEAGYPRRNGVPGAPHARPTIEVGSWDELAGERVVIVGGYESGIDAAVNLVTRGHDVTVIDPGEPWRAADADPSLTLAPYTLGRLRDALATDRLTLHTDRVTAITPDGAGFLVTTGDGETFVSDATPLLATGFEGSLRLIRDRFTFDEHGRVELDEATDASTITPGLYLAGPALAHREAIFCFIYKFRQRFGVVARAIGDALGVDTEPLEALREHRFLLDDLSCCDDACAC